MSTFSALSKRPEIVFVPINCSCAKHMLHETLLIIDKHNQSHLNSLQFTFQCVRFGFDSTELLFPTTSQGKLSTALQRSRIVKLFDKRIVCIGYCLPSTCYRKCIDVHLAFQFHNLSLTDPVTIYFIFLLTLNRSLEG